MLGYINEERQMEHLILRYHRELNGPQRILAKLASRGYGMKESRAVMDRLIASGEMDLDAARRALIEKKLPSDASDEDVKKLLYKNGYGHD